MENTDEIIYIKRILEGEVVLFSYFVERYSRPIHTLIIRIIPTKEDAEELTQDTFLKAYRKLDTFKGDCTFSTWLYRIAYNTAVSATRKKKIVFRGLEDYNLEAISDEAVDLLLDKEDDENLLQRLDSAIDKLNVEDKTLITLYYLEEKPISEVAAVLELTPDNVKVKLFRARKKLFVLINS
ncbi:MAG: sigma-70 family RNA polymerase sigma factor [Bacteroidota bacterium]|nr:sigma-70 family RNA polymerase sigma factor [Bacteroidota bacterium]